MPTFHVTVGLPASGKTTLARQMVEQNPQMLRANRDDLRMMLGGTYFETKPKKRGILEAKVTQAQTAMIEEALGQGRDVICDDTNLDPRVQARFRTLATNAGAEIQFHDLTHVTPQECIKRDLARERSVGSDVIWSFFERHLAPAPYQMPPNLRDCIIVDIDGTLAEMDGRSPYEWNRVGEDKPNRLLIDMIDSYAKKIDSPAIIVMSGRDGSCFGATETWLEHHGVPFDRLFMRAADDTRKDSIVKRELFDRHIRGKFNPILVIDDRQQVVEMWRHELGLTCWQVASGRF